MTAIRISFEVYFNQFSLKPSTSSILSSRKSERVEQNVDEYNKVLYTFICFITLSTFLQSIKIIRIILFWLLSSLLPGDRIETRMKQGEERKKKRKEGRKEGKNEIRTSVEPPPHYSTIKTVNSIFLPSLPFPRSPRPPTS